MPVCPPRFAYKAEYEKFKLYLTIILILVSFTCRFLLNSRWASCRAGLARAPRAPAPTLCPPRQGDRRRLQLPAGLVLLHPDNPREHPHQQRLPVGEAAAGARVSSPFSPTSCPPALILGTEGTGVTAAS